MTDDYLLQEFHEAGIWLPEEREAMELRTHIARGESILQRRGPSHPTDLSGLPAGTIIPVDHQGRVLPGWVPGGLS